MALPPLLMTTWTTPAVLYAVVVGLGSIISYLGYRLLREDAESLATRFFDQVDRVAALGIETAAVLSRSLITLSCGAGSLTLDLAEMVLTMARDVSEIIRKEVDLW